jgi:hypothetical protein
MDVECVVKNFISLAGRHLGEGKPEYQATQVWSFRCSERIDRLPPLATF